MALDTGGRVYKEDGVKGGKKKEGRNGVVLGETKI